MEDQSNDYEAVSSVTFEDLLNNDCTPFFPIALTSPDTVVISKSVVQPPERTTNNVQDDDDDDDDNNKNKNKNNGTRKRPRKGKPVPRRVETEEKQAEMMKKCFEGDKSKKRRKRRFKPGTVALREIRKQQKSWETIIPKSTFTRVVKSIATSCCTNGWQTRFTRNAIDALRTECEQFVVDTFKGSNRCAIHAGRQTVTPSDLKLLTVCRELLQE